MQGRHIAVEEKEMRMKEQTRLKGHWTIEVRVNGELRETIELDNQLTEAYRQSILNQLAGNTATDLEIKYLAVGTDNTPATAQDTTLGAELFRSVPTARTVVGTYMQTYWVLTNEQANGSLREIGVFAGDATASPNTGTMISRIVIALEKNDTMEVTFIRKDYVII